jgi:DNA-binding MarR family transcriptional regulator
VSTSSGQNYRKNGTFISVATRLTEAEEGNCTSVFHDVMRLRHALRSMASEVASSLGLQSAEMSAIDTLGKFGPLTMGELARRSFFSPPNTTRTVKILVDRGLVRRQRSQSSDREVNVSLTAEGKKIFRKSYPHMVHDVNDLLASKLSREERRTLAELLAKLIDQE